MEVREASAIYAGLTALQGDLMPVGYKRTEVGVVPTDWVVVQAGELHPFVTSGSRGWAMFYSDTGAPFIRITNLARDCIFPDLQDLRFVKLDESAREGMRTQLQTGDVLISITADIGIVGYVSAAVQKPAYINQHIALIRFDRARICSKYVSYFWAAENSQRAFRAMTDSGAKAGMNLTTVKQILLAAPPTKAEQEAIAEALSDADALIESLEQLIAKKRQIKQGTMQALLTGKQRLPEFNGNWQRKKIGYLLSIMHGKSQHAVEEENGIYPILATGGQIGFANRFLYDKPSVLIGRKGTIDRPQFMDTPFWSVDTLFYSVVHEPNVAKYLFYRFCLIDWRKHNEASGVPSLNARTIEQIELEIPKGDEQAAIATILTDMDTELAELEARLTKTRQLKQGMMQELLTGRIRLV